MSYIRTSVKLNTGLNSCAYAWLDVDGTVHITVTPKAAEKRGCQEVVKLSPDEMDYMCRTWMRLEKKR